MAPDAAMNCVTWRYFQRENELPLRWKSTRLDATRGGAGVTAPNDKAVADIATACGSCACTMSGR